MGRIKVCNSRYRFYKISPLLIFGIVLLFLPSFLSPQNRTAKLKMGETLKYNVIFGGLLKGQATIKFYGIVTSYIKYDTTYITLTDSLRKIVRDSINSSVSDSVVKADTNSSYKEDTTLDLIEEMPQGSTFNAAPESVEVVLIDTTNIYYITYDTKFLGSIYNSHADIYTKDDFSPLFIETKIMRNGKVSHGSEIFYPAQKMAIFSQVIKDEENIDTIIRKNPLQDITTLPFYFLNIDFGVGDSFNISLPQDELKLTCIKIENIQIGGSPDYNLYRTYYIESEPQGFNVWLDMNNKIPVKVHIEEQKINMFLKKVEITQSLNDGNKHEQKVRDKLRHLFP